MDNLTLVDHFSSRLANILALAAVVSDIDFDNYNSEVLQTYMGNLLDHAVTAQDLWQQLQEQWQA